jgi:MoaA/NifB/PqqE/SkfB family radical SAM enzyme
MKKIKKINYAEGEVYLKKKWIRLTRKCNNCCLFCLDKDAQDGSNVSFRSIQTELLKGIKAGAYRVVLSGGDPTLHPDFTKIVAKAKEMGYRHIQCVTNGRMFSYSNFLRSSIDSGLNEVTFSFHGHHAILHDQLTGVNGSFAQSLRGLRNALRAKKLIVSVDIVINKLNVRLLDRILDFFINEGVREFDLLQIIPFGRAWDNRKKLLYNIPQVMPYLEKVFRLSNRGDLHIWLNRFPPSFLERYEHLIQNPSKLYEEVGAREVLFNDYINKNVKIPCYGHRCRYCFLCNFCVDLALLKKKRILKTKNMPKCCRAWPQSLQKEFCLGKLRFDVRLFLSFFIKNRFFVKSLRCKSCKELKTCQGWPVEHVYKNGFQ